MSDAVLTEPRGRVLLITLNRPEAMNAINHDLAEGVLSAVSQLDGDDTFTAGVLTGSGRAFCAGMDLKAFAKDGPPRGFMPFIHHGARKPLIAAVEGLALAGGLEVALVCDLIVAARGTKFGIPEVAVGLFAAGGALLRLPGRLPYSLALELALTGDPITAEQAYEYGLVSRLADTGRAVEAALELAGRIARNAPLAVAATKHLMHQTRGLSETEFWEVQTSYVESVFHSEDAKEGARAFAEKRPPAWCGR